MTKKPRYLGRIDDSCSFIWKTHRAKTAPVFSGNRTAFDFAVEKKVPESLWRELVRPGGPNCAVFCVFFLLVEFQING